MPDWVEGIIIVAAYFALVRLVLPKLGVPT
jgi:hypothetical protein